MTALDVASQLGLTRFSFAAEPDAGEHHEPPRCPGPRLGPPHLCVRLPIAYAQPYWRMFAVSAVGMVFYAATEPLFAAMMKPLLDGTFIDRDAEVRQVHAADSARHSLWCGGSPASSIPIVSSGSGRRVVADLRQEMFEHLLRSPAGYFDTQSTGQILAKLTYNVENVADAATTAVTTIIRRWPDRHRPGGLHALHQCHALGHLPAGGSGHGASPSAAPASTFAVTANASRTGWGS